MADKRIQDLTPASSVQTNDLFVLEQSGAAKSLTGQILINDLATFLDGHGGISDIVYTPPVAPSLDGTLTITMADETVYSVTVKNGNGITSIVVSYGISNNGTDPTTVQSWGSAVTPPTNQYPFGWTRIRLNQTTGVYTDAYSVTVKADDPTVSVGTVSAQPGPNASASITNTGTANDPVLNFSFELPQGEKGDTGDYIVPVVSYGTSTAAAVEPSTWYNDPSSISYSAGNFIWKKTAYTLYEAQTVQDTKTEIIGYIGLNGSGSGTVTQITMNGTVYADDGTGNIPMTVDAEDVGAIADPVTKANGQVLTYDSTADEWVAANPSTGNVNTVNNKGVDTGTTNVTVYATDIKMSSSDSTTIPVAMPKPQTSGAPADLGTAARGSATTYSRSDHVHKMPSASDVGLGNVDNVRQYSASNPPPYPVQSVNGQTGAVTVPEFSTQEITLNTSGWTVNQTKCFTIGKYVFVPFYVEGTPSKDKTIATGLPIPKLIGGSVPLTSAGSPPSVISINTNGVLYISSAGTGIFIGGVFCYETE